MDDQGQRKVPGKKFHVSLAGCTNGAHETYVNDLKGLGQIKVSSPEQSDYLVLFCPIASRVGTDIGEAMDKISGGKPIVLVVMHHTYDKDYFVPESRRLVENPDVIVTVDVLFHESKMLICNRNDMAWSKFKWVLVVSPGKVGSWRPSVTREHVPQKVKGQSNMPESGQTSYQSVQNMVDQGQRKVPGKKFHVSLAGCTNGAHQTFVNDLKGLGQIKVISPEQSDYLVLFCPIASRVGTDIGEAMDKISGGKPIVLVVMHHTYDKDYFVPESRRLVENPDVIVTVDVLFHESKMLTCNRNDMARFKVEGVLVVSPGKVCSGRSSVTREHVPQKVKGQSNMPESGQTSYQSVQNMVDQGQRKVPGKKFHVSLAGCTNGAHETYVNDLKGLGQTEVSSPEQSDYLVLFCPIASRVGTDIGEAMDKISGGKPIVLVVMHHTYDKDYFVPENRRLVENPDVFLTVDVLFHESKMLICNHNDMAWSKFKGVLVVSPGKVAAGDLCGGNTQR
ncbi:Lon protease [Dissostichus eleginoides]|uniref:Lon protease n=1 Tax=Dissostichus eleginoides TaxID=100907 RepID=A0AAD9BUP5_DISEL|nr:Lon protease [Dissostichus eleginoides]